MSKVFPSTQTLVTPPFLTSAQMTSLTVLRHGMVTELVRHLPHPWIRPVGKTDVRTRGGVVEGV